MKRFLFVLFIFKYVILLGYFLAVALDFTMTVPFTDYKFSFKNDPIEEILEEMTLEEKVGQLFIVGFWGKQIDLNVKTLIDDYHIGGVILLGYNLGTDSEIINLVNSLQNEALVNEDRPLFISIDQEGGPVSRLSSVNVVPQAEIETVEEAQAVAQERGQELKTLGINVNYSPVLDFVNQPGSFLYDRTFRGGIELKNELGRAMVEGYQAANIIPVIKHFPGHPDDKIDSHKALPTSNMTKQEVLYKAQSFQTALNEDPMMVMSGHIAYPQVDANYPASLSSVFLEEILRGEWAYDGVIITDDLEMGALQNNFTNDEIARLAFLAGNDILLYSSTYEKQIEAYEAVLNAVQEGEISEERLDESVRRILELKEEVFE